MTTPIETTPDAPPAHDAAPRAPRSPWRALLGDVGTGVAAWIAAIATPSALITAYALGSRDAEAITRFALAVAEPAALAGAAGAVALLPAHGGAGRGRVRGGVAAAVVAAAALWTGDVDGWTLAAIVLLPLVGAWRAGRRQVAATGHVPGGDTPVAAADEAPALSAAEAPAFAAPLPPAPARVEWSSRNKPEPRGGPS